MATDTTFAACEMSCFDRNCAPRMRRVTGLHTSVVVTGVVYALIKKDIPADQLDAVQSSSAEEEELDLDDIKVM